MPLSTREKIELKTEASRLFSPRTPIGQKDLFAGRAPQIMKLVSAINQPGAHAIIYGERGVGKTSLANVAPMSFAFEEKKPIVAPRINCDGTDDYETLWRKVFSRIPLTKERHPIGLKSEPVVDALTLAAALENQTITPAVVEEKLSQLGSQCHLVIVLDEFDRLRNEEIARFVADTIKSLSDYVSPATVVIVGVADSVANLVRGHESVSRHLVEIPLPRMSRDELEKILEDRLPHLTLEIETEAQKLISLLCRGLPYYAHLLGQHAACLAIDLEVNVISPEHVYPAMSNSIDDSEREMRRAYYEATSSRHPNNLYAQSLAACALALSDEFGYFAAADVRQPMSRIMGRKYDIPNFAGHLERFCDKSKGGVLEMSGTTHQRRYRFSDPLMEPFVIIKSLDSGVIEISQLG